MKDKIINLIKIKGPVIPLDITKSLNTNSIMAGAYLSELVSSKSIKISNLKIGGSPLYYLEGQESRLQDYIRVLKLPEKKAYDLLKEKKILKNDEIDPVTRVSLQNIKDFAKPIEITFNNKKEKYWKWYMLSSDELQETLKTHFKNNNEKNSQVNNTTEQESIKDQKNNEPVNEKERYDNQISEGQLKDIGNESEEQKKEDVNIDEKKFKNDQNLIQKDNSRTTQGHEGHQNSQETDEKKEVQNEKENNNLQKTEDQFYNKIINLLLEKKIEILNKNVVKANSEIELTVLIPTSIGKILYFVVAKSKKKCTDADLSQAYVKAEMNKLPVLFIYSGDLTKKANEMLKKEFKIITTYKID